VALSYLIGTPVLEEKWSGGLKVSDKRVDPRWVPTPDMRRKDPTLPLAVEGGDPRNPLGRRALYLGDTLYRIHGTDAPWTVGQEVSNGCVRLYNRDIHDLYSRVPLGAKVIVTWDRFEQIANAPLSPRERHAQGLPWRTSEAEQGVLR
jgi:lipoprotein-anchoring transpeptidase ErfK/SrfK